MNKILLTIAAVSALAATTVPAAAAPYNGGGYDAGRYHTIDRRQDALERRIDLGLRSGALTRREAARLKAQLRETARLERRYRSGGLNGWERADLDRRFDRISAQIRYERNDRDYGSGYGPDRDNRDHGYGR